MPLNLLGMRRGAQEVLVLALPVERNGEVPPHALVGELDVVGGKPAWSTFRRNVGFVDFYTSFMRGELAHLAEIPASLGGPPVQPGEHVYIIDKRVGDGQGDVPFAEIVGWYKSTSTGAADAHTFEYNLKHAIIRADGRISEALDDPKLHAAAEALR